MFAALLSIFVQLICSLQQNPYYDPNKIIDKGEIGDNVYYELIEHEYHYFKTFYIFIKGKGDMYDFKTSPFEKYKRDNVVQADIEEGVTSIGSSTFAYLYQLTDVIIPNTVKSIGSGAFSFCRLYSINIPDSVTYIGKSAFEFCTNLEYVNDAKKLSYIGDSCFGYCDSLRSFTFYEELTYIGQQAFYDCTDLTSINFINCNKLNTINWATFYLCVSLISIKIPDCVNSIQSRAFRKCSNLKEITIPKDLTVIESETFYYCCKLKSIKLPEKITKIRVNSFIHCCSIETIYIPENVEIIENNAFLFCYNIKSFSVDEKNEHYSTIDGILTPITKNAIINYPPNKDLISYEIPNNIINLVQYSFCYCRNLKHITIPSSIEIISAAVFQLCQKLESVTFLGNCQIGQQCFNYCYDLVSFVYLGENDAYLADIIVADYNKITVYVPNSYTSDTFCGYEVIKTNDILCRAIHHKCIECNENLCTQCEKGWKIENGKCIPDCESTILHCKECTTSGICLSCEKGYILENEQCIETNICDDIIENCGVCHKSSDGFYCDHCFDGFTLSSNGVECIKSTNTPFQKKIDFNIDAKTYLNPFHKNNALYKSNVMTIILSVLASDKNTASLEMRNNYYFAYITTQTYLYQIVPFNINLPPIINKQIKQFSINNTLGNKTDLCITCPKGSAISYSGATIPKLRGSRTIEIIKPFSINKVILDEESSEPLTLKTPMNQELYIFEIQVQYKQKIISESSFCKTIIINENSELTLEKMRVDTVKIGFSSSINIRNDQTFVSHFNIFPSFNSFNKVPIKFYQPFPKLDESDIYFDDEQTIILDELPNEYIAAKFIGENENENKDACLDLKINVNNTVYRSKCKKDEYGPNYNFVVTMSFDFKNKKKIIAGKIVSYAICGLVSLLILLLSIYYIVLHIKYKCAKNDEDQI